MMYEKFESNITEIFYKHVPVKEKYCRKNQLPYMKRELRKAIYNKKCFCFNHYLHAMYCFYVLCTLIYVMYVYIVYCIVWLYVSRFNVVLFICLADFK
jgi:hypothetical protein